MTFFYLTNAKFLSRHHTLLEYKEHDLIHIYESIYQLSNLRYSSARLTSYQIIHWHRIIHMTYFRRQFVRTSFSKILYDVREYVCIQQEDSVSNVKKQNENKNKRQKEPSNIHIQFFESGVIDQEILIQTLPIFQQYKISHIN